MNSSSMRLGVCVAAAAFCLGAPVEGASDLKVGMIGLDTSHVTAFTALLNDTNAADHVPGARVVAAFKGGSADIESSRNRVEGYTKELTEKYGVKVCATIEDLCREVDAVMLESVDGRPHLAQARPVIQARKPLFIDKPMAASLRDAVEIFRLAREAGVPVFSASSLRFATNTLAARAGKLGRVTEAETWSPCHREPTHPEMFWYGIHGVESLFTVLGTGCETVSRGTNAAGLLVVNGRWSDGVRGVYREDLKGYGGKARGEKGELAVGNYDGYAGLVREVVRFFQTGKPPVAERETLEILAFMEAADESGRRDGAEVALSEMLKRAGVRQSPAPPNL